MSEQPDRAQFLNLAALLEGGLVGAAVVTGWFLGLEPLALMRWDLGAIAWGIAATLPLIGLLLLSIRFPIPPIARVQTILVDEMGPFLAACKPWDLVFLAMLAGFGEELMFRGVLQPVFERLGPSAGLIGSNVIFGLAHARTATYAVLAGAIGVYLGVVLDASGERNLLAPIVTHALYDYLAFLIVLRLYHDKQNRPPDEYDARNSEEPPDEAAD